LVPSIIAYQEGDRGPPVYARPPGAQSPTGPLGRGPPLLLTSSTAAYVTHRPTPTATYVTHRPRNLYPTLHFVPNAPKNFAAARHCRGARRGRGGRRRRGREKEKGEGEGRRRREKEKGRGEGKGGGPRRPCLHHPPLGAYVTHRPPPTAAYVTHRPTQISLHFSTFQTIWVGGRRGAPARP
jgi:hypothetical protein